MDYQLALDPLTLMVVALTVFVIVYLIITSLKPRNEGMEIKKTLTSVKCKSCDYSLERPFKEGDYVGKILEDKCPKCGGDLVIKAIYVEKATNEVRK